MTGISAHCMARCRIEVPSVRALGSWRDDLGSSPSVAPDWSLIARDMAAVSPFRSDSNTLNSFTDCSIDVPLGAVGDKGAGCWWAGDVGLSWAGAEPAVDMVAERCGRCFLERVRAWPGGCEDVAEAGGEVSLAPLGSGVVTSVLEETRVRRFLTALDLERLCLRGRLEVHYRLGVYIYI